MADYGQSMLELANLIMEDEVSLKKAAAAGNIVKEFRASAQTRLAGIAASGTVLDPNSDLGKTVLGELTNSKTEVKRTGKADPKQDTPRVKEAKVKQAIATGEVNIAKAKDKVEEVTETQQERLDQLKNA